MPSQLRIEIQDSENSKEGGRKINSPAEDPVEKGNKGKKGNEGAGNVANKENCLVTFLVIVVPIYKDIWL